MITTSSFVCFSYCCLIASMRDSNAPVQMFWQAFIHFEAFMLCLPSSLFRSLVISCSSLR